MSALARAQALAYQVHQRTFSTWARVRYGREFDRVAGFLLFVGYPRSGHSLVGALLNAHRDAVVSHELDAPGLIANGCARNQLYARILARASWFDLRGNISNYAYQVPRQWQGRFASLRLIGDKRGGALTRHLAANPDFLDRVRALVQVPIRLVHVVRNPWDNISAISIWNRLSLEASIEFYFEHCQTTARLDDLVHPHELITFRHEEMIAEPRATMLELCRFLDLTPYAGYVEDCSSIVFERPTRTRRRIEWPAGSVRKVEKRASSYPLLAGYTFDVERSHVSV